MSTEGARLYIQLNLSGERTEDKFLGNTCCMCHNFYYDFFGAVEFSAAPFLFSKSNDFVTKNTLISQKKSEIQERGYYAGIRKCTLPNCGKNQ